MVLNPAYNKALHTHKKTELPTRLQVKHQRRATPKRESTGKAGRGVGPELTESTGTPTHAAHRRDQLHHPREHHQKGSSPPLSARLPTGSIGRALRKKRRDAAPGTSKARGRSPQHHPKATCRELQDGGFKKHATPERRHHPIRGSWIFIRSLEGQREAATTPSGRERRPWTSPLHPEISGKGFPPTNSLRLLHRTPSVDPRHPSHRHRKPHASHRATPVAEVTDQHLSPWHARQPTDSHLPGPPPRRPSSMHLRRNETRLESSTPNQPPAAPWRPAAQDLARAVGHEKEGQGPCPFPWRRAAATSLHSTRGTHQGDEQASPAAAPASSDRTQQQQGRRAEMARRAQIGPEPP